MNAVTNLETSKNVCETSLDSIMSRSMKVVRANDTVAEALRNMVDGENTLPVVDDFGRCIGILSRADLAESLYQEDQELARFLESEGAPLVTFGVTETCNERQVRELMSEQVTTALATTTARDACALMAHHSIHQLPVVDANQRLIGIVSSLDLLGIFCDGK